MGAMEQWSKIYGGNFKPIYIEDWDWIQIRLSDYPDWWVSCWGSGSAFMLGNVQELMEAYIGPTLIVEENGSRL